MKRIVCILLVLSMLPLSSCSFWDGGTWMAQVRGGYAFENDAWLIVEEQLVRKEDGEVIWMELDTSVTMEEIDGAHNAHQYAYRYVFGEESFEQYTFLQGFEKKSAGYAGYAFCECVITYGYDGKETDRTVIGEILTREETEEAYAIRLSGLSAVGFTVSNDGDGLVYDWLQSNGREDISEDGGAILDFAADLCKRGEKKHYQIEGLIKPVGDETWFSVNGSDRFDDLHPGQPLLGGMKNTQITAYDTQAETFKTVFEYDQRKHQIIDFDENGAYLLDKEKRLSYIDFDTGEETELFCFPRAIDSVVVTDRYLWIKYHQNGYSFFVYERGAGVIAND